MAIITKAVIFVALVCAISALPVENGQEQQEAQVDLLSVDDIPDQDVGSTVEAGQVRDKRHGFYGGFGVPVVSIGYGGKCTKSLSNDFPKLFSNFHQASVVSVEAIMEDMEAAILITEEVTDIAGNYCEK